MSHLLEEITSPVSQWDHMSLDYNSIWITSTSKILSRMSQSTLNMATAMKLNFPQNFPWFCKWLKNRYPCKCEDLTVFTKCTSLRVDQTVKSFHHLNTKETLLFWSSKATQATREANFKSIPRSIDWVPVKHTRYSENQAIILMKSVFICLSISKTSGIIWDVVHLDQELESCKSPKVFNCTVH